MQEQHEEKYIFVGNQHRSGKGVYSNGEFFIEVEVKRQAGRASYTMIIDGKDKGITRMDAGDLWLLTGDYLGAKVVESKDLYKQMKKELDKEK